jgi:hypothetical protein
MVKLKIPVLALPTVTVNGAPLEVGTNDAGASVHVPGLPVPQERLTLWLYPLTAVNVPFHVTVWAASAAAGVAVTATTKSGTGAITARVRVRVLGVGAPALVAWMVTL